MKSRNDGIKKKIMLISMVIFSILGLCACGKENDWLFSLNGERLYSKDVAVFAYIYVMEYNIQNTADMETLYERGKTYGEYHKEQLEKDIIETILLYKEAKENNIKLSKEEKEQVKIGTENVLERFGEDFLEQNDISESDIEDVYEMKYLGDIYMNSLSGGEETDSEDRNESEEGKLLRERYVKVYQVTFPVAELDDNGMVQTDAEGNLKKISQSEIIKMKQAATEFAEKAKAGENIEILLSQYGKSVSAVEKYMKYDDMDDEYRMAVDKLSENGVSDVIESDYGYCVIRLLEKEAEDYSNTIAIYQEESEVAAKRKEELDRLYSAYAGANVEYKNNELWKLVEIQYYIK